MPITDPKSGSAVQIDTERLKLRQPSAGDADAIARLANDWEVARFTARMPHPYARADAENWIANAVNARRAGDAFPFAITDIEHGRFIGAIGLHLQSEVRTGTLGFWLGRTYWGRGYMTEAVCAVLRFAFKELSLERVVAGAVPDNTASIRVQEKAGMRYIGRELEPAPARGGDQIVEKREIAREAWRE